jgi:integrase
VKSHDVRIWGIKVNVLAKGRKSFTVRWRVGTEMQSLTLSHRAQADNFRTELKKALKAGEAFDTDTGLPDSMQLQPRGQIWLELARTYVAMKWPDAAANSRSGIVESMVTVAAALVSDDAGRPPETVLRQAIAAFLTPSVPDNEPWEGKLALEWLRERSVAVAALAEPSVVRQALDAISLRLDGTAAAPSTKRRKRAIFYNALEYAIELGVLEHNPIDRLRVKSRRKRVAQTVDRRVVANPLQVRSLLIAVAMIGDRIKDRGLRLVVFFACMYFAAMRPEEVAGLREQDCYLPSRGWGRLTLEIARTDVGKKWTDTGERHETRGLKHRADNETRSLPIPPELVELLRWHIATFGVAADGRLFRSVNGGVIGSTTYARVWQEARRLALTPAQFLSVLAARPYDLRHAAVSLWLNSGVPATEVADRAGQSVKVLLEIYAKCIDGDEAIMNDRIEAALG